jgi:hypothetical protein
MEERETLQKKKDKKTEIPETLEWRKKFKELMLGGKILDNGRGTKDEWEAFGYGRRNMTEALAEKK